MDQSAGRQGRNSPTPCRRSRGISGPDVVRRCCQASREPMGVALSRVVACGLVRRDLRGPGSSADSRGGFVTANRPLFLTNEYAKNWLQRFETAASASEVARRRASRRPATWVVIRTPRGRRQATAPELLRRGLDRRSPLLLDDRAVLRRSDWIRIWRQGAATALDFADQGAGHRPVCTRRAWRVEAGRLVELRRLMDFRFGPSPCADSLAEHRTRVDRIRQISREFIRPTSPARGIRRHRSAYRFR